MKLPDASRWAALSPLLDELLDLAPPARAHRLADHARTDPALACALRALLEASQRAAASGLLEGTAHAPAPDDPLVGTLVGAYRLERMLGEGGGGVVWRARRIDGQFDAEVAIKLLHLSRLGPAALARFRREAGILACLRHPHIAGLFDAGVLGDGRPYLMLELVEGEHIDAYADARRLGIRQRVQLFRQVLLAVAHAHGHLVVHRDLKPANILVDRSGNVKLLDFGIAKLLDADGGARFDSAATLEGGRLLTPAYAAPEQLANGPLTTATDVYALGVLLYRLLAGGHPTMSPRSTPADAMRAALEAEPMPLHLAVAADTASAADRATSPQRLARQLRGDLGNIVARCLRKAPDDRYASATELGDDLRRYLEDEPVRARADSLRYRAAKFVRRHRGGVAAAVLVATALAAASVVSTLQMIEARRQRAEAGAQAARAEASNRFLSMMVGEIGSDNGTMSPARLIDRGVYLLDQQPVESRARADQLVQMSVYYDRLNETAKALALLSRAEALARRLGYVPGLLRSLCGQVDTELTLAHPERARARLAEASALLGKLPRPDPMLEANCDGSAAAVEDAAGHSLAAIAQAEHGLALMRASGHTDDPLYAGLATRLSKYHDDLGHAREAHAYTLLASLAYERAGAGGTIDNLTMLNNAAADLVNFGQLRQALAISDDIARRMAARGADPAAGLGFSANRGAILAALGRHDEALQVLGGAIADAARAGNAYWENRARYFRARTLLRAGRHAEARLALDQVERAYRHDEARNGKLLAFVGATRAEWLLRTGALDAAEQAMGAVLAGVGFPAQTASPVLRGSLPIAAEIALARHDLAAARLRADAAVSLARQDAPEPALSADLGRSLSVLAKVRRADGVSAEALDALRQAVPALEGGLGPDHGEVREARALIAAWEQGSDRLRPSSFSPSSPAR